MCIRFLGQNNNQSGFFSEKLTLHLMICSRSPEVTMEFPLDEASGVNKWPYIFQEWDNENRLC